MSMTRKWLFIMQEVELAKKAGNINGGLFAPRLNSLAIMVGDGGKSS
ncbi:hypothetical protein GCM10027217_16670 [Pseudomaricurvus hydrocarbonicus]